MDQSIWLLLFYLIQTAPPSPIHCILSSHKGLFLSMVFVLNPSLKMDNFSHCFFLLFPFLLCVFLLKYHIFSKGFAQSLTCCCSSVMLYFQVTWLNSLEYTCYDLFFSPHGIYECFLNTGMIISLPLPAQS